MIRDEQRRPGFIQVRRGTVLTKKMHPAQILVFGFLVVILIGTFLLMLPISSASGEFTKLEDALFTATSAVCVTGLSVYTTATYWSLFGKIIIICCIQIGGLGFMSLVSMIFVLLGKKISLKNRMIMQEALNMNTTAGVVRFTRMVVRGTLVVELVGALFLCIQFIPEFGVVKGIWYSIFHSVSAFCNAGFDLIGDSGFMPYVGNTTINMVVIILVILSGLGFSVWVDIVKGILYKFKVGSRDEKGPKYTWKNVWNRFSLHTKLVIVITFILIIIGFLGIFIFEYTNPSTLGKLTLKEKIYAAMFQSVSPRTAGFATIPLGEMTNTSKVLSMILMFIGGSPAGTAGGIKTVTVGVLALCVYSTVKGYDSIVAFKRRIPFDVVSRALTIIMIGFFAVVVGVGMLSFTEDFTFMEILFEVISAFATVGTTLGITPMLSTVGKVIIIILMFIGRLGPITITVALMVKKGDNDGQKNKIQYPEEKVMVG